MLNNIRIPYPLIEPIVDRLAIAPVRSPKKSTHPSQIDYLPMPSNPTKLSNLFDCCIHAGQKYHKFHPYLHIHHPYPRALALFFHKASTTLDETYLDLTELSRRLQITIIAPELPGCGQSTLQPTYNNLIRIAETFSEFAVKERVRIEKWVEKQQRPLSPAKQLPNKHLPLILIGESLGTGSASYIAARHSAEYEAVIMLASFTSVAEMADTILTGHWASRSVSGHHFDNLTELPKYDGPVLLVHGREDEVVPPEHAVELTNALNRRSTDAIVESVYVPWEKHWLSYDGICGRDDGTGPGGINRFMDMMGWSKRVTDDPVGSLVDRFPDPFQPIFEPVGPPLPDTPPSRPSLPSRVSSRISRKVQYCVQLGRELRQLWKDLTPRSRNQRSSQPIRTI
ncbi:hypothetical protein HK097_005604 [Rhizophlyctis rosea]|uniref:Peptidase S9 prolyl oligopeptidase catalytic domain-containing protein n=1 Tax=Rhizophlyctis rosea TaxID=64517 RepID=A0AAD5S1B8_9FUNG|nr:hypothetical protein HK097_005604 [Rhizophlyctis rosea]